MIGNGLTSRANFLKLPLRKRADENSSLRTPEISAKKRVIKANAFQENLLVAIYFKDDATSGLDTG